MKQNNKQNNKNNNYQRNYFQVTDSIGANRRLANLYRDKENLVINLMIWHSSLSLGERRNSERFIKKALRDVLPYHLKNSKIEILDMETKEVLGSLTSVEGEEFDKLCLKLNEDKKSKYKAGCVVTVPWAKAFTHSKPHKKKEDER